MTDNTQDAGSLADAPLPCDVFLAPCTVIKAGVPLSTLVTAMQAVERPGSDEFRLSRTTPPAGDVVEALRPFAFLDMGEDEDEGVPCTTQDLWETIYQERVKDWFDFQWFEAARAALSPTDAQGDQT